MGSEDMALLIQEKSQVVMYIGSANADRELNFGHHNPKFNFDERFPRPLALITASVIKLLISLTYSKDKTNKVFIDNPVTVCYDIIIRINRLILLYI